MYRVAEVFYSIQGEGCHAGRPAVFCRFKGCNLWSGKEADRHRAICKFCDTDFASDGQHAGDYDAPGLAGLVASLWPEGATARWCVLTGGEPALQADGKLVSALKLRGFATAIETNGTRPLPPNLDWVTLSPKAGAELFVSSCDELKLVWPQSGLDPAAFDGVAAGLRYLQPMDGPAREANLAECIQYVLAHPRWRLSDQRHKAWGLR